MCGIAGIISKNLHNISLQRIRAATDAIAHRGPEGEAFYMNNENTVALGHRRLSIIDLSDAAAQPMSYFNRYYIIHNGELYNYVEVRDELQKKGCSFLTQSDTEVIVAAYDAYGAECLQHFDGMFAFAIWDEEEQQLFAARDRFGEKPFFYFHDEEQFVFASEMKSLWAAGVPKKVNGAMLYNFLTIGYTSNPADPHETFFKNISKLPAASYLTLSLQTHELAINKFWEADVPVNETIDEKTAVEQFQSLLSESVGKRLRSDVPVGTSLSGGIDSSSVVALCAQQTSHNYTHKCFTSVFPDFENNEQAYAAIIAEKFNLKHHLVQVDDNMLVQQMDKIMLHQEEPVTSSSAIAQYNVYKAAKQNGVTVLLDGQGADEALAGYHKYFKWYWQELYRQKKLRKSNELKVARELDVAEDFSLKNKLAALFPEFAAAQLQSGKAKQAYKHADLNEDFAFANKQNLYYSTPTHFNLSGALYFNTFIYGLEELLRYADRNSMAHAAEVRLPFLNHQLVEFLFSLPSHLKIKNGWTKWLLRQAMEDKLPEQITWRKDKVGFEPPQKRWMSHKHVQDRIQEGKKVLVQQKVLSDKVLKKAVVPKDAHADKNYDWRYWSASYLFQH
ncbi:MAG: asparagine synthase (glutamine-hydrolyzing) [Chitinophagaceae bacterium]|nr:asparagine synthase (glutamine-hydrolyzing) [Chitinophagaceae bacterium]